MMKMAVKKGQGDDYFNRLLSYLKKQFKEPIVKMTPIRDAVFLVDTGKNTYVIKGYSKYKKLRLQEAFTATLRQEGFDETYLFLPDMFKEVPFFEGEYFGCIEYLQPNSREFSYHSASSRKEGLVLLSKFHAVTASVEKRYRTLLHQNSIQEKWTERMNLFIKNFSPIRQYLNDQYIQELLDWSQWSLEGIKENESLFSKKPHVILHGDVAHHNFLRDRAGVLHLIDFDLISIGPACLDILQYANRILPYIDWSLEGLRHYPQIEKYLKEKAFLYALAFPTDILREWNRIIREFKRPKQRYFHQVLDLTLEQFHLRRKFFQELKGAVNPS